MKNILSLGISILFHVTVIGIYGFGTFPVRSVQSGLESIEMEIVIRGEESGKEIIDQEFSKEFLNIEKQFDSKRDRLKKETQKKIKEIHQILKDEWIQKKNKNKTKEEITRTFKDHHDKDQENKLRKVVPQALEVRSSLDSGALVQSFSSESCNPSPKYPRLAILKGWEGETLVRIRINDNGEVGSLNMVRSSGYAVLDESVMKTLRGWRFEKGFVREIEIPVKFFLKSVSVPNETFS